MAKRKDGVSLSPDDIQLLASIESLLGDGENQIAIPMTAINQGIAQLSHQSAKTLTKIQGDLIKSIDRHHVENSNYLDSLSVAILRPLQDWQLENELLLTQLAASAGLTQPGDPLEAALVQQLAEEPQLAYSATLLIALRDALPHLHKLIVVLGEIRDRMPPQATVLAGDKPTEAEMLQKASEDADQYPSLELLANELSAK